MIDVAEWRTKAGLTQAQFGELMELSQSQVSRLETNPESADVVQLQRMAQVFGVTIADLLSGGPVAGLRYSIEDTSGPGLELLAAELRTALSAASTRWPEDDELSRFANSRTSIRSALQRVLRRPRVVLCGPFDAGKSTLINGLIGSRAMTTRYQPTTSIIAHLRHTDTQPDWMDAPVWVLDEDFEPERWEDETHVREHRIAAGGLDTLREHGEHSDPGSHGEATYALAFLDAPILKFCELLDTPGDGHDTDDELLTGIAEKFADVLIFLSPVTGFLGSRQPIDLMRRIKGCAGSVHGGLDKVFILATHAAKARISDEDLTELLDRAAARLALQMTTPEDLEGVEGLQAFHTEDVRSRMFGFYDSNQNGESRGQDFLDALNTHLSQTLPPQREHLLRSSIEESLQQSLNELNSFETRMSESTDLEVYTAPADGDEFQRRLTDKADEVLERLRADVDQRRTRCAIDIDRIHDRVLNKDSIRKIIDKNFTDKALKARGENASPKKAAQQDLPGLVMNELGARVEASLLIQAKEFGRVLDDELEGLRAAVQKIAADLGEAHLATDFTGAFVGAAMGGVAVGALALWASTLGNLGAYIIAAQAAGWLSAIGISLPAGGATLTAAMAAMGGPIGVAAAILVLGAIVGFTFRRSWEDRLAKNLVAEFAKPNKKSGKTIKDALLEQADQFWDDTINAVRDGLRNVVDVHTRDVVDVDRQIEDATAGERREQLRTLRERGAWLQDLIFRIKAGRSDA